MKFLPAVSACIATLLFPATSRADVLVDFGMNGSTPPGHPDQRTAGTSPAWNNIAIGNASGGALAGGAPVLIAQNGGLPNLSSAALVDASGAASGVSLSFSTGGNNATSIGTAGTGGNYDGALPPAAAAAFPAASATRDSLYINTSGTRLTVTFSGLDNGQSYDLTAFSGRNGNVAAGGIWELSAGTAAVARFQNSAGSHTGNIGQAVSNGGTNAGLAIQWLGVAPANGVIAFSLSVSGATTVDLNAIRIAPAAPLAAEEVDVYFLGGQSNMVGYGTLSQLTGEQKTPPPDVAYWTGSTFVPLVPGSTVTSTPGNFGPEISFASEISKLGRKTCIVKYADGGRPLDSGWSAATWLGDPPGPDRITFYPGTSAADPNRGTLYKNGMLPHFQAALEAIRAAGNTPVIRGLAWMQGESDARNGISASRYASNLKLLRDRLASDLGLAAATDLPLVFGRVLPKDPPVAQFTHRNEVRAEMELADQDSGSPKAIPACRMISTDDMPLLSDNIHYTSAGLLQLGRTFAHTLANPGAAPLHIAFHNSTATRNAMAPAAPPALQGSVVNTASDVWNNLQNTAAHTFTDVPLDSANGGPGIATISGTTGYTGTNSLTLSSKDRVMMEGWYGLGAGESMTVKHLPAALSQRYHVIVYGDSNESFRVMKYTIGGVTKTINDNGTFSGEFIEGKNHVVFTGLSGDSFTLTGNTSGPRSAVCGISIIPGDPFAISSFTADDRYIQPGAGATLSWNVTNADSVSISPAIGNVAASGSVAVSPAQTTTYTLTATRGTETITKTVRIGVGPDRPNIVLFLVDDMGWQDTSLPFHHDANGNPIVTGFNQRYRTPNMQALAASGVKFTNAHSAAICSPSRSSLMTGQSPARHRVTQWTLNPNNDQSGVSATLKSPLDWNVNSLAPESDTASTRVWRTDLTLPGVLGNAGYRTIHCGKAHFGPLGLPGEDPRALGFDINIAGHATGGPGSYYGEDGYGAGTEWAVPGLEAYHGTNTFLTEALTLEANKAIASSVADGQPFYLYMSHYAIHAPFNEDPRFSANYPGLDARERTYATMIEGMDKSLGDIRAKLQQLGVAENTIIVFYSDNGGHSVDSRGTAPGGLTGDVFNKPLRAGKGSAHEGGTRVPAIASWASANPANAFQQEIPITPATRCDKPLIIEDLYPTFLRIASVSAPAAIDGKDVSPYLTGNSSFTRPEPLLFHYPHIWYSNYIARNNGYEMHSSMTDAGWKIIHYYEGSRWELYNLNTDLGEANNLAASRPDLVMQLGRKMIRMLMERNATYPADRTTNVPKRPLLPANSTIDSDNDGRTDLQEDPNRNGIVDPGETDPDNRDSDGDGTDDGAEAKLGLDPNNPSSVFRSIITPVPGPPGTMRLTWPSLPGAFFTIRAGEDLVTWPELIVENLPAAPSPQKETSYDVSSTGSAKKFFRVELE